jgi:class 3 adenylate cyclase
VELAGEEREAWSSAGPTTLRGFNTPVETFAPAST